MSTGDVVAVGLFLLGLFGLWRLDAWLDKEDPPAPQRRGLSPQMRRAIREAQERNRRDVRVGDFPRKSER